MNISAKELLERFFKSLARVCNDEVLIFQKFDFMNAIFAFLNDLMQKKINCFEAQDITNLSNALFDLCCNNKTIISLKKSNIHYESEKDSSIACVFAVHLNPYREKNEIEFGNWEDILNAFVFNKCIPYQKDSLENDNYFCNPNLSYQFYPEISLGNWEVSVRNGVTLNTDNPILKRLYFERIFTDGLSQLTLKTQDSLFKYNVYLNPRDSNPLPIEDTVTSYISVSNASFLLKEVTFDDNPYRYDIHYQSNCPLYFMGLLISDLKNKTSLIMPPTNKIPYKYLDDLKRQHNQENEDRLYRIKYPSKDSF